MIGIGLHRGWQGLLALGMALLLVGCGEGITPPAEAPSRYDQLVRLAVAETEARADTSLFWLRNTGPAQARSLMIGLGVNYLRYDRGTGVLCAWQGEGLWPARGYVTAPASDAAPTDSIGIRCNIEGQCSTSAPTDGWTPFTCQ